MKLDPTAWWYKYTTPGAAAFMAEQARKAKREGKGEAKRVIRER